MIWGWPALVVFGFVAVVIGFGWWAAIPYAFGVVVGTGAWVWAALIDQRARNVR